MFNALRTVISELHRANRASLDGDCDALKIRIEQGRREGRITEEQAAQLTYDVHNERARCFRNGFCVRAEMAPPS